MGNFIGAKTREYKSGNNSQTGTLAKGEYFNEEFDQLYGNDNYLNESKVDRNGDTIDGDVIINGKTTVNGDLVIVGNAAKINTTDMEIEDNTITLNKGESGAGVTKGTAGIEVDRGSSTKAQVLFDESDDSWYAGIAGALKKIAADMFLPPVGSIIAYMPGYFTSSANGGFTAVSLSLSAAWKVCNGAACLDAESPIFAASGRYLPNLTDNRFLMGSNAPGGVGGQNSYSLTTANLPPHTHDMAHSHGTHSHSGTTATEGSTHTHSGTTGYSNPSHTHLYGDRGNAGADGGTVVAGAYGTHYGNGTDSVASANVNHAHSFTTGAESAYHTHTFDTGTATISLGTTQSGNGGFSNTAIENRPLYLACKYIMRIK